MKTMTWTCAVGVWTLLCACDQNIETDDAVQRAAAETAEIPDAPSLAAPEPRSEAEPEPECECDQCDHAEDEPKLHAAAPGREVAKPLDAALVEAMERRDRPAQGVDDAKLEIVVFNDFECPFCRKEVPVLEQILAAYPDDVRLVFKQMPLPMHKKADAAARASLAAHRQGKFWQMHDALFEQPSRVRSGEILAIAADLGLDLDQFEQDMADPEIAAMVERDVADARQLGIRGTPSMLIGDNLVVGALPLSTLRGIIDAELAEPS